MRRSLPGVIVVLAFSPALGSTQVRRPRTEFHVQYVSAQSLYIDGGRDDGLAEEMQLEVGRRPDGAALVEFERRGRVRIIALAAHSAACEILTNEGIEKGDLARLSREDAEVVTHLMTSKNTRHYAQTVTFSDWDSGNPLEDEQRAAVPRPPLSEINRVKGQISFQQSTLLDHLSGRRSFQEGVAIRADVTRMGGTYWNFDGYWRGRLNSRTGGIAQETLTDLISRTYEIGLTYESPQSKNVAGFGRLLLPWASSLSTLDGGYFGRRLGSATTVGAFAGATPDPTSWNFSPDRQIAGAFSNFEVGSYEKLRYSGTFGLAHSWRSWKPERPFAFAENHLAVNRKLSLYHSLEVDYRTAGRFGFESDGPTMSRSYFTMRARPTRSVSFDLSHNFFRGTPSFDYRLVGTGLLDRLLFQGISGGVRVELPRRSAVYANFGRSSRRSDDSPSWNYLLGFTYGRLPYVFGLRADVRTSRFSSSFGSGRYSTLSLSRNLSEQLRFEVQAGQQTFSSSLTRGSRVRWVNSMLDWFVGRHYLIGLGFTYYGGDNQRYDQFFANLGYRF